MLRRILPIFAVLAILLAACGGQAEPTLSPEDVQGTAVSSAWTMVAMTQEAIPTNTPIPPTETPSPTPFPTETPIPLPTQELIIPTATQAASSGGGTCAGPLNMGEAGPTSRVRVENETGGSVTLSLNLSTNQFGQCGALSYQYSKGAKSIINLPRGDWWAYAWITTSDGASTASCSFTIRVSDFDLQRLVIQKDSCRMVGA